ncbi:hypothetical protein EV175_002142 [Coemansia sp. RSA 1933]|nr:hypothetical protein EV175_002142 [Coemansia sp. RSA 1933]
MAKGCVAGAMASIAVALALLSTSVLAHSWVDCVKYDPFNEICLAYARGYPTRQAANINTAYVYLFSGSPTSQTMCNPIQQSTENYTASLPMATAQPGETIYTTWEQNGHMNNTNPTQVYILYYADSTKEFSDVSERLTAPVAGSFNFATTANCYSTQPNSVCLGSWVVPENLAPGYTYHFVWFWYFNQNPAGEWYSTCFDMNIQDSSHVVGTADMATLLQKGDPPDSYAYGLNDEASSLLAQVTTLSENQSSSGTASEAPASTTDYAASVKADVAAAVPASSTYAEMPASSTSISSAAMKCIPRPIS